jgi:hypothetical protein
LIASPDHHGKARKPACPVSAKRILVSKNAYYAMARGEERQRFFAAANPGRGAAANTVLGDATLQG